MLHLRFWGVRGSIPSSSADTSYFGGNTACVEVRFRTGSAPSVPILLDLGTGARQFSLRNRAEDRLCVLLSHVHLDHVQGFSFMPILDYPGAEVSIFGARPNPDTSLEEIFEKIAGPPVFPVPLGERGAKVAFTEVADGILEVGIPGLRVETAVIPHTDRTLGFRISSSKSAIAYITDHQQNLDPTVVDDSVLQLCRGVELLIHDGQYTDEEFLLRSTWGHSTPGYALKVAELAGAKRLALFHHDPDRTDRELKAMVESLAPKAALVGVDLFAARDGLEVDLD